MNRHQMPILGTEAYECASKTMFPKTKAHSLGFMKSTSHQSPGYCLSIRRATGERVKRVPPSVLGCLGCRQAPSRSTESCLLLTAPPRQWVEQGELSAPSSSFLPGAGSYHQQLEVTHEPRQHIF